MVMVLLGFSAGLPLLLIFSSLGLWLREAGVERSAVTYFSWAALGYSFKFVWAPLVDQLPLPWLAARLGRRRSWMLCAQLMIALAILMIASIDPQAGDSSLLWMAIAAVLLGFSAATQDIVIDAYRIESASVDLQAMLSAGYIAGYRIGMLLAGAGSLYLADWFGTSNSDYLFSAWQSTYQLMALAMLIGIITTLSIDEPDSSSSQRALQNNQDYLRFAVIFIASIAAFIGIFYFSSDWVSELKTQLGNDFSNPVLAAVLVEMMRLLAAITASTGVAMMLVKAGVVQYSLVEKTYVMPIA
ncbi:MAG: PAT family beta-lactamase induction signal transducer AmpG, partial [Planctomycetota bacterium]